MARALGFGLLAAAVATMLGGSAYRLTMPSIPDNHVTYLGLARDTLDARVANLDLGLLRAIGGCTLAIGVAALIIVVGPVRRGEREGAAVLLTLVVVSEGVNAYVMYRFGSPWFVPLAIIALTVAGLALVARPATKPATTP